MSGHDYWFRLVDMSFDIDWEDAFLNGDYIADAQSYPPKWQELAAKFRETTPGELDISYGDHARMCMDLFLPAGTPKGLMVFVHGGYWRAFDKSTWSHLAQGAIARGFAAVLPSYILAPEAQIPDITRQIGRAITLAATRIDGPIHLIGHSAGGHLVSRMGCQNAPVPPSVAERIKRIVSLSGVHDLRPLLNNSMNQDLSLTPATAASESPALLVPRAGLDYVAWVGAHERPEFLRQSALIAESWSRQGINARLVADPLKHHFDVIDGLTDAAHPLTQALLD
jgi:alpha-beta hydrolase superfamily lysophospholipase